MMQGGLRMDLGKSKRRGLCCPPSVSIVVLFSFSFFFFLIVIFLYDLNV